ncbi:glycosyltransferase family 2 protein [Psychroserpens sp.]|uniref:glycosyltransferase family 2 protein n=1 Tax=Psychroserpens sp. TaxID=2020870 RepID=UPI00385BD94C
MVSIVIPYYNRPKKLNRALESVFNQAYTNFEVLLIDDCSKIKPNFNSNQPIAYFRNSENKGPGYSRNFGMQKAKGDYIVFLDADDYWHEDYLLKTVAALKENPDCIMAYANGFYVDDKGNELQEMRDNAIKPNIILPNIFLDGRPWGTAACLWDRLKIKDIRWVDTRCWEDYVFDTNVAVICNKIIYVDAFLIYYDLSNDEQKLSREKDLVALEINRNESLMHITKLIEGTVFFEDKLLKSKLIYYAFTNAIAFIKLGYKNKVYYHNIKNNIKGLGGKTKFMNINIILGLNSKIGLKLMRYFRKINSLN